MQASGRAQRAPGRRFAHSSRWKSWISRTAWEEPTVLVLRAPRHPGTGKRQGRSSPVGVSFI